MTTKATMTITVTTTMMIKKHYVQY